MDRRELKIKLDKEDIPESWYSLDGEAMPNKSILQKGGGKQGYWIIYNIDERGHREDIGEFYHESETCIFFYQMMKKYKERDARIKNMPIRSPFPSEKQQTFIVSESGEASYSMTRNSE